MAGEKQKCEFMYGEENTYLKDEKATGFIKKYKDSQYAFVGILPNKNVSVKEYIAWLDGNKLNEFLTPKNNAMVLTALPKFKTQYESHPIEALKKVGITKAFDPFEADFSGIGTSTDGDIYIYEILQKTNIEVSEEGTKAASVTAVITEDFFYNSDNMKTVKLNRPFIYMIIDQNTNIPIFMGTVNSIN